MYPVPGDYMSMKIKVCNISKQRRLLGDFVDIERDVVVRRVGVDA